MLHTFPFCDYNSIIKLSATKHLVLDRTWFCVARCHCRYRGFIFKADTFQVANV